MIPFMCVRLNAVLRTLVSVCAITECVLRRECINLGLLIVYRLHCVRKKQILAINKN